MGHWIKIYRDGSRYVGDDRSVSLGEKSWRNSSNENIRSVSLYHGKQILHIGGPGEFWQSDRYEADMETGRAKLILRRIERQISPSDKIILIHRDKNTLIVGIQEEFSVEQYFITVDERVGQWMILEMDLKTKELSYYFNNTKV